MVISMAGCQLDAFSSEVPDVNPTTEVVEMPSEEASEEILAESSEETASEDVSEEVKEEPKAKSLEQSSFTTMNLDLALRRLSAG